MYSKNLKCDVQIIPNKKMPKRNGVTTQYIYNLNNFLTRKILKILKRASLQELTVQLGFMCPRVHMIHQQWHSSSCWNTTWDFCLDRYTFSNLISKIHTLVDILSTSNDSHQVVKIQKESSAWIDTLFKNRIEVATWIILVPMPR